MYTLGIKPTVFQHEIDEQNDFSPLYIKSKIHKQKITLYQIKEKKDLLTSINSSFFLFLFDTIKVHLSNLGENLKDNTQSFKRHFLFEEKDYSMMIWGRATAWQFTSFYTFKQHQ